MDIIKKLQQIGFSKREAEVYAALLQKREFTAPELAKITTVTRTKIYEILQNLIHKGMCNENNKNGQKLYRAVKPNIVLRNVISNIELEIEQQKKAASERQKITTIEIEKKIAAEKKKVADIEQRKITAVEQKKMVALSLEQELTSLYKDKQHSLDPLDYIEVITDRAQIRERWLDVLANTKEELVMFTKPPYSISFEENLGYESELIKTKKVIFKSIYEYKHINTYDEKKNFISILSKYENIGEEIRLIPELPMKLAISDFTTTILSLNDRVSLKESVTTIIVNHPSFATFARNSFLSYWMKGKSLKEYINELE
ncbi:MAG: helix-turn-helix domain-containing protein [Ignavibacteriaceae bacterium]|jgi:sugar-specific transcriptional regulator TrmB|nr:helix-turn-helix domain-containing protein [Ignavibacteriaceae bacterium]